MQSLAHPSIDSSQVSDETAEVDSGDFGVFGEGSAQCSQNLIQKRQAESIHWCPI